MEGFSTPFTSPLSVHSHASRRAGQDLGRRARTIATQKDRHNVAVLLNPKLSLQNFPEYDWYFRLWDDNYVIVENVPAALEGPPRIIRSQSIRSDLIRCYLIRSCNVLRPSALGISERERPLMQRSDCTVLYCRAQPRRAVARRLVVREVPRRRRRLAGETRQPYDRNVRQPMATCNTCNMDGCAELCNRPCCTLPLPSSDVVCRNRPIPIRLRCVVLLLGHRPPPVCLFVCSLQ